MRMRNQLAVAGLLVLFAVAPALADAVVPEEIRKQAAERVARGEKARQGAPGAPQANSPEKAVHTVTMPLVLDGNGNLSDARLVLPRKLLATLQASLSPGGGAGSLPGAGGFPLRTVLAGVALSLALVWVGLRLIRSPRRLGLVGVGALMLCCIVLGTGCPPRPEPFTAETYHPLALTQTRAGKLCGEAYVEVADSEEGVVLQLPIEKLEQFVAQSGLKIAQTP